MVNLGRWGNLAIPFLALASLSFHGCVIIPTPEHGLASGRGQITEADTGSLEVGKTTREEVLLRFGEPSASLDDEKIFIYDWSVIIGYWGAAAYVAVGGGNFTKRYQVTLEFDERGRLERHERTLRTATMPGWFRASGEPFSPDYLLLPEGRSALFVYYPGSFINVSVPILSFDTEHLVTDLLTDLQSGSFALATVGPGRHELSYPSSLAPASSVDSPPWALRRIYLELAPEQKIFLRVNVNLELAVDVSIVTEKGALAEISRTERWPSLYPRW